MAAQLKRRLYQILETGYTRDWPSRAFDWGIGSLIVLNVLAATVETVPSIPPDYGLYFLWFEIFSVAIFTVEYGARLWVCTEHPPLRRAGPIKARLLYARTPLAIIDLLAILPFYVQMLIGIDLRALRIFRLLRFLKLARYSPALMSLGRVLYNERRALAASLIIMLGLLLFSASIMYTVERGVQPDKFGSIPAAMWWALATLTTVGYGDVTPVTWIGKIVGGFVMVFGLGMFALPIGIIATGFATEIHHRDFAVTFGMVARVPLFSDLEGSVVAQIVNILKARTVASGTFICREGDEADSMYILTSGSANVIRGDAEQIELSEGDFFGEIALLRAAKRNATVVTTSRSDLLVLDAQDFQMLLRKNPEVREAIEAVVNERMDGAAGDVAEDMAAPARTSAA